jgi:tRNA pseudouridine38-40 synthase
MARLPEYARQVTTVLRIRLDLAYLGTRFEGWQEQAVLRAGVRPRTVQATLEEALGSLYRQSIRVHGASRTDSGVHARGQVAHFDEPGNGPRIPPDGLQRALNSRLAGDLRVTAVASVPDGFHARFSAIGKTYRYRLRRAAFLPPFEGLVEALASERLDVDAMREGARLLTGRRDFRPFSITGSPVTTTVRTLRALAVEEDGPRIVITAEADGFLRGMVRRLVGTLRDVGRGRRSAKEALTSPGPTAEARGLTLEEVEYGPDAAGTPGDAG